MRKISSQILLAQVVILTASMAFGFLLLTQTVRANLDRDFEARAAAIAQTVASVPMVQQCMVPGAAAACAGQLQEYATATMSSTGASYVVLIDMQGIRHSHPDPSLVGQRVSEPVMAADGQVHLGINSGSQGLTANARVPLFSPADVVIGEVSVGIQESSVSSELVRELPSYGLWFAVALLFGAVASWFVARRMKKRTFGLELDEIARLLQEREATLHGIREGVLALDPAGRISVVNDAARRLLNLPDAAAGRPLVEVVAAGELRDILIDPSVGVDELFVTSELCLVVNRMPVVLRGKPHGTVITLRDRTDLEGLARELDGQRSLTESLRAQQHEFTNRLHAIAGLLELDRPVDALSYLNELRGTSADFDESVRSRITVPQIVGLLLGKAAEASERGVELVIAPDSHLDAEARHVQALTTVLGNMIDNAFDALMPVAAPRFVEVRIVESPVAIEVSVADNGIGIPESERPQVFDRGFTTKRSAHSTHGGLGLALVMNAVTRIGGTVEVEVDGGTRFTVTLPTAVAAEVGG